MDNTELTLEFYLKYTCEYSVGQFRFYRPQEGGLNMIELRHLYFSFSFHPRLLQYFNSCKQRLWFVGKTTYKERRGFKPLDATLCASSRRLKVSLTPQKYILHMSKITDNKRNKKEETKGKLLVEKEPLEIGLDKRAQ